VRAPDKDFFVTYSGQDEPWATWIAAVLEEAGYTTVLQAWDFRPGDNFMAAMDHALGACRDERLDQGHQGRRIRRPHLTSGMTGLHDWAA
jgi:hypothetical protein